jgi:hypothetical protein
MTTSDAAQPTPYYITPRVWRDEQPGDTPLEVRAGDRRWSPSDSKVSPAADGAFEVTASGDATLPAGATATILVTLQTSAEAQHLTLTTTILRVN